MIELHKTDHILNDAFFEFDYSKSFLQSKETENLENIQAAKFRFKSDFESKEFRAFLVKFFEEILKTEKVYLVYIEKFPEKQNRIRSYKKLFSTVKDRIGKPNLFEKEVQIASDITALISTIKLTKDNLLFIIDNLINSTFSFGYIVKKGHRSFSINKSIFLESIILKNSQIGKSIEVNFLKLTNNFATKNASLFRILLDGRDNQLLEVFGKPFHYNELLFILEETIGRNFHLRRIAS